MKKYKINKTIREINAKIKSGDVVVVTAEEIIDIVKNEGPVEAARQVDVVTTGTFAPMCSSGAFINFGHSVPGIKASKVWLNRVPAYAGVAAVDCYIGATEAVEDDRSIKSIPESSATGVDTSFRIWLLGKRFTSKPQPMVQTVTPTAWRKKRLPCARCPRRPFATRETPTRITTVRLISPKKRSTLIWGH